jgi:hypothetical protein
VDVVTAPGYENDGALRFYVEPDTWCNPLYSIGSLCDLMRKAWEKRELGAVLKHGIVPSKVERLLVLVERATKMSVQDAKGITAHIEVIKKHYVEPKVHVSAFPSGKERAARRLDSLFELMDLQHVVASALGCVRGGPVNGGYTTRGPIPRARTYGSLFYFDKYEFEEAELKWRVADAGWAAAAQLRGRERVAAFEAIWMSGEHARAYEFVGAKLPPPWVKQP